MKFQETSKGDALYLNQQIQFHHVFDRLLDRIERADKMIVSSFAVTEAIIRRIIKNRYRIGEISLFLDFTVASRNMPVTCFAEANVDALYLLNNHSKTIWVQSATGEQCLAVISNNATNNHRFECGFITGDPDLIDIYLTEIEQMKLESVPFNGRQ